MVVATQEMFPSLFSKVLPLKMRLALPIVNNKAAKSVGEAVSDVGEGDQTHV